MRIIDSIMPMSDVEALAANGQKLRVAVTKTSAQGKAAQSATPNLMSFSTDENSVWFNGKKYGVHVFKNLQKLNTTSSSDVIKKALNIDSPQDLESLISRGLNFVSVDTESTDKNLCPCSVQYTASSAISITYCSAHSSNILTVHISVLSGGSFKVESIEDPISSIPLVNNTLTSTSTSDALSAAMGKRLQDEKLAKADVVNNLTTASASKALSAAQGKALNDKISGLGNVYRVKGTKNSIEDVYSISSSAKLGDVWNVATAFTLGGSPYPANTNVVCIAEWSTSQAPQSNWDPLGGTVNLSAYVPKSDIVDNINSSDTNKPLSANQGKILSAKINNLDLKVGLYKLLKSFTRGTLSNKADVDSLLGVYSTFNSAVTAGKLIYGIYNDGNSLPHAVTFTAYNSTSGKQVIMYAVINPTTMVKISANYEGTNWVTATIEQGTIGESTIIE